MKNRNLAILALALMVVLQASNANADTKSTQRDRAATEYNRCIDTVKRVASKEDDVVGMIARCREYALKHNQ